MAANPETGFLVIADLTGYTAYLARSELQHAPTIAGDLLETIVGRLEPPLRLTKFEGDAAFLYAEDGRTDGPLLLDAVEASYLAFRRRLRSIGQATSCECNSCRLAPQLDLKLFIHHGSYLRSRIAGRDELAGSDVILVHRLLKQATGDTHSSAFALFTAQAMAALGVDPPSLGMTVAERPIEHLGLVSTFALDLESRWQAEAALRRLDDAEGEVVLDIQATIRGDQATVWAHLTSPALRSLWEGALVIEDAVRGARRGVGTTAQCVTGRLATLEEIVDWQPYDHIGWRLAVPEVGPVDATADLEATDGGTRIRLRWSYRGDHAPPADELARVRTERAAAYERLARVITASAHAEELEVDHAPVPS